MMKGYRFYIGTLFVVFILFTFATMTVNGQGEQSIAMEREFYEELEDSYTARLRDVLSAKGYRNAGITMTKVYRDDRSREYTVQIHHKRIKKLDSGDRTLLLNELEAICFGDENCEIAFTFLDCEN